MANRSQMLSAGVYPNDKDQSTYTSATMSTTTGIVGIARRGPLDLTIVTDETQLVKLYGEPTEKSYGIHAAIAILKAGGPVAFQRVVHRGEPATAGTSEDALVISSKVLGSEANKIEVEVKDFTDSTFNVSVRYNEQLVEEFSEVILAQGSANSVDSVINSQSSYIQVKVNTSKTVQNKTYQLSGGVDSVSTSKGGSESDAYNFESKYYDSLINGAVAIITPEDELGYRHFELRQGNDRLEYISNLTTDAGSERNIVRFINEYSDYVKVTANADALGKFKPNDKLEITMTGGKDGISGLDKYDVVGTRSDGLMAFADSEVVELRTLIAPGFTDYYVIASGIKVAADRGDCIFPYDGEENMTPQQIVNWSNGVGQTHDAFNSEFGALYYPWLKIYDKYTKKEIFQPSAGYVAAQYVINDTKGDVYEAPAGLTRGVLSGPIGVKYRCSKLDRDLLYGNRNVVNPIVSFIKYGIVIWGQKTNKRIPSVYDRVNNRRLGNYFMSTVVTSTLNLVFEGNHDVTWDLWKMRVEPIFDRVKAVKGIIDYKLIMGEESVSQNEIENHIMPGQVLIKYNDTAEFIPLDFVAVNRSTSFEE